MSVSSQFTADEEKDQVQSCVTILVNSRCNSMYKSGAKPDSVAASLVVIPNIVNQERERITFYSSNSDPLLDKHIIISEITELKVPESKNNKPVKSYSIIEDNKSVNVSKIYSDKKDIKHSTVIDTLVREKIKNEFSTLNNKYLENKKGTGARLVKDPKTGRVMLVHHKKPSLNTLHSSLQNRDHSTVKMYKDSSGFKTWPSLNNNVKQEIIDEDEPENNTTLLTVSQGVLKLRKPQVKSQVREKKLNGNISMNENAIIHTCRRLVKTKSRTVLLQGECECEINNENELFDNESGEAKKNKKNEGNMDEVKKYISLTPRMREPYKMWRKSYINGNGDIEHPEYKVKAQERLKKQTEIRLNQKHSVFHSWESVLACKDRVEDETRSKYLLYSKTKHFNDKAPLVDKKVLFELKRSKGDSVMVPYNGIPLMCIGHVIYRCHLGKDQYKTKKERSEYKQQFLEENGMEIERLRKLIPSKKVGCPATFSVSKVARFPDFEVTDDTRCKAISSSELRKAWMLHSDKVRYYIEYHVKRPKVEDHFGHEVENIEGCSKFKEPVDKRVLQKIQDLTYQGVSGVKKMREKIKKYVLEELFKNQPPPPEDRRRYNPSFHDIRNAMKKAKKELRESGHNIIQIQCAAIAREIAHTIENGLTVIQEQGNDQMEITIDSRIPYTDDYLLQLKNHLNHLNATVKEFRPLEPYLASHVKAGLGVGCKSAKMSKKKEELPELQLNEGCAQYDAITEPQVLYYHPETGHYYTERPEGAEIVEQDIYHSQGV